MLMDRRLAQLLAVVLVSSACGGSGSDSAPCTAQVPVCTVSSYPSGTAQAPVGTGTTVSLYADCNVPLTNAVWFTEGVGFDTGTWTAQVLTSPPGYSTTYSYGFTYGNCAGSNYTGITVVVSGDIAGGGGGGGGGTGSQYDSIPANECVLWDADLLGITNTCTKTINVGVCAGSAVESADLCKPHSIGGGLYSYNSSMATIQPGGHTRSLFWGQVDKVVHMACRWGPSGASPAPFITEVNFATDTFRGVCH